MKLLGTHFYFSSSARVRAHAATAPADQAQENQTGLGCLPARLTIGTQMPRRALFGVVVGAKLPGLVREAAVPAAEPTLAEARAMLPHLQHAVGQLRRNLSNNSMSSATDFDRRAMPYLLAVLNQEHPGLNACRLDWPDLRNFIETPGDGVLRGVLMHDDHYSAVEVRKRGAAVDVVNIDSVRAGASTLGSAQIDFRSKKKLGQLAAAFPQANVYWSTTKTQNTDHDCGACAIYNCLAAALQRQPLSHSLAGKPGATVPGLPGNMHVLVDGEQHLPVEMFRHSQGRSHLQGDRRFAGVLKHWHAPENCTTRSIGSAGDTRTVTMSRSIENQRIEWFDKAIAYCQSRLAADS